MTKKTDAPSSEAIMKHSRNIFFILSKKGIINYVSSSLSQLNINPELVIDTSFYSVVSKKDQNRVKKNIKRLIEYQNQWLTFTFETKKGHILETTAKNLFDQQDINGILLEAHDITNSPNIKNPEQEIHQQTKKLEKKNKKLTEDIKKRKKIQSQLEEGKEQYQLLINYANEGICVAQDGILKFVNPKICDMLQYSKKEMLLKPFISFIHPEDQDMVTDRYKQRVQGKKAPEEYTFRIIDKKGHTHWVQIHAARFLWNDQPATVNFLNEISEKVYIQKKYEKLFDIAPILTAELEADTFKIISVNNAFQKSIGISSKKLIGKKIEDFLSKKIFKKRYQQAKKAITEDRIIKDMDERDGRYFYNIYLPVDAPGGKKRLFLLAQDITDIRLSEQKYRRLIDSSPDAIAEIDGKTQKITTVNPAMANNFKTTKENIIGKNWKSLLPKEVYKKRYALGLKVITENKIQVFEDERKGHYFQNIFVPFQSNQGYTNLQVISRDITKQKQIQKELEYNKDFLDNILNTIGDPVFVKDKKHRWILLNDAYCEFMGYPREELLGKSDYDFFPKQEADIFWKKDEEAFETGIENINEEKFTDKKGIVHTITTRKKPYVDKNGEKILVGIIHDITELKKMEKALRRSKENLEQRVKQRTENLETALQELKQSEHRYRSLIETAPIGIALTDMKGNVLVMNPAIEKITGFTKENIDFDYHCVHKKDMEKLHNLLKTQGFIRNCELELLRKNGAHYFALIDVEPIRYKNKSVYLTLQRDITEIKEAQQQLKQVYDYLNNVINSASEFIFTINQDKKISMWNKTAEEVTGMSASQVNGKTVNQLSCIVNPQLIQDSLKNIKLGYSLSDNELVVKTKHGKNAIFRISCSVIKGSKQNDHGYLIMGQNVSKAKRLQEKIVPGSSYLQYKNEVSQDESLLIDFKLQEKPVLLLTRGSSALLQHKTKQMDLDVVYFDDNTSESKQVSSCDDVFLMISEYFKNHDAAVVIMDRVDYLVMNQSFEHVLRLIYRLNSLVDRFQAVFILQINPNIFSKKELSLLKEEFLLFEQVEVDDFSLEESLYQILSFVYTQNQRNIIVSYSKVGKHFGVSKVTTGKRISELKRKGLVSISLKGRMKAIYVTKKAEDLLSKRENSKR
ncbi:MAG: PAS domain S-box protein [Candidatus Thermoplasmatota archaeon]|nr:PAS domain S-box protein [Candidatus Thermoplasmatota archaeon]